MNNNNKIGIVNNTAEQRKENNLWLKESVPQNLCLQELSYGQFFLNPTNNGKKLQSGKIHISALKYMNQEHIF